MLGVVGNLNRQGGVSGFIFSGEGGVEERGISSEVLNRMSALRYREVSNNAG